MSRKEKDMDIRIVISADDTALEFSRNLKGFCGGYISQSNIEAGIAGALGESLKADVTIAPDTLPYEDDVDKGLAMLGQAKAEAKPETVKAPVPTKKWSIEEVRALAKSKVKGPRFKELLKEISSGETDKLSELDPSLYGTLALRLEAE